MCFIKLYLNLKMFELITIIDEVVLEPHQLSEHKSQEFMDKQYYIHEIII